MLSGGFQRKDAKRLSRKKEDKFLCVFAPLRLCVKNLRKFVIFKFYG